MFIYSGKNIRLDMYRFCIYKLLLKEYNLLNNGVIWMYVQINKICIQAKLKVIVNIKIQTLQKWKSLKTIKLKLP